MKKIYIIIAMLVSLSLMTCKKDAEPEVLKLVFEEEQVSGNTAVIKGAYEYSADIKDIEIRYSTNEDLSSPLSKEVLAEGKAFTITLENLESGTQYYYRLYFSGYNTKETETRSFRTEEAEMASVTTKNVTNITVTSAECGGEVISDGGSEVTARGICWSTSQNPTIADNYTDDGNGIGSFTSQITGLTENTTYYVRAYATNEKGTVYGEERSFVTLVTSGTINGYDWVDLGLPSGLKWATCNIGAENPEDYGDYYAWGETETKSTYTEENSITYGVEIEDISGNPEYDAATANWGSTWRMPTKEDCAELVNECTWQWTTQNGVNGQKVTGPNDNYIFLPAAGYRDGSSLFSDGNYGNYWSSTPADNNIYDIKAYYLNFGDGFEDVDGIYRYYGQTVRPVSE